MLKLTVFLKTASIVSGFLICATVAPGQQRISLLQERDDLLADFQSKQWSVRAASYYKVSDDPNLLRDNAVKTALLNLLDQENSLNAPDKPRDGEDYGEYISALVGTVASTANWEDPRQLCILAHSPYDPESELAQRLAVTGLSVIPCFMRMAESRNWIDRYKSIALLIQIRARVGSLSPKIVQDIREVSFRGLRDPQDMVRSGTVHALAKFGAEDMISALQDVAEHDPGPEKQGHSIRKSAVAAIQEIQERARRQPPS